MLPFYAFANNVPIWYGSFMTRGVCICAYVCIYVLCAYWENICTVMHTYHCVSFTSVCVWASVHICVCEHLKTYVCMYVCMYACMHACMYVCVCMCVYVCVCMYMYVYVCICICMYMYVYVCICMYMYAYVCICICIYIYILCVHTCTMYVLCFYYILLRSICRYISVCMRLLCEGVCRRHVPGKFANPRGSRLYNISFEATERARLGFTRNCQGQWSCSKYPCLSCLSAKWQQPAAATSPRHGSDAGSCH